MSISAGEPIAAGVGLIAVSAASGLALFAAFGGSLIGAGISIVMMQSQISSPKRRVWRFLLSVFAGPVLTLAGMEIFRLMLGVYTVALIGCFSAFLAWKLFTVVNNRSTKIIDQTLDKALGQTLGIKTSDDMASVDRKYIDSDRANHWRVGREVDQADGTEADRTDKGSPNGR